MVEFSPANSKLAERGRPGFDSRPMHFAFWRNFFMNVLTKQCFVAGILIKGNRNGLQKKYFCE